MSTWIASSIAISRLLFTTIFIAYGILFFSLSRAEESYPIYINEFIPNPVGDDSKLEFIELYNSSDQSVDVSNWVIDTGGSAHFSLDAGTSIQPNGFLTFFSADKNIALTNSGDHIQLIRFDAVVQDDITYTASKEGYSYNRIAAGSYQESSIPTPNAVNAFPATPTPTPTATPIPTPTSTPIPSPTATVQPTVYSSDIHVSEFLPNPEGDDGELEFIELHNESSFAVDLSGWIIDTGPTSRFSIPLGTSIGAGEFLVFLSSVHDISLSNSSDRIQLIKPDMVVQDDISYSTSKEGYSYNRSDAGLYEQSFTPTPGMINRIVASPSPTPKPTATPTPTSEAEHEDVTYDFSSSLVINEVFPNPAGSDETREFIEIKSFSTTPVHLFGWTLDDSAKGTGYHFPKDTVIGSRKIVVFYRDKTKIALNNSTETVKLIDPNGKIVSSVTYTSPVPEDQSWSRDPDGVFVWTEVVTANQENNIVVREKPITTPKPSKTKKATAVKSSISQPGSASQNPTVLGSRTEVLPWSEVVSRTVVFPKDSRSPNTGKQRLFALFGVTAAFVQLASGISHNERVWRR